MSLGPNARRLQHVCPALFDILGNELVAVLDSGETKTAASDDGSSRQAEEEEDPQTNDEDGVSDDSTDAAVDFYWQQVHLQFIFRVLVNRTTSELAVATLQHHHNTQVDNTQDLPYPNVTPAQLSERLHLFRALLHTMEQQLETSVCKRGLFMKQFATAYRLTPVEVRVVQFLVTAKALPSPSVLELLLQRPDAAGTAFESAGDEFMACEHDIIKYVCGITSLTWKALANEDHVLCSDRILVFCEEEFSDSKLSVSEEACRALMGMELSVEDKLKLSGTKLLSVLRGETTENKELASRPHHHVSNNNNKDTAAKASVQKMLSTLNLSNISSDDDDETRKETSPVSKNGDDKVDSQTADDFLEKAEADRDEKQSETETASGTNMNVNTSATTDPTLGKAYSTELQYLKDQFEVVMQKLIYSRQRIAADLRKASIADPNRSTWMQGTNTASKSKSAGEISAKIKLATRKIELSLERTREEGTFFPRLELLVEQLGLDDFEKFVLVYLAGSMISPIFKSCLKSEEYSKYEAEVTVGDLLNVYFESFEDQVAGRTYFYRSSTLARKGLIKNVKAYRPADLTDQEVQLDRRVLDCIVGLDKESSEISHGSHLYEPKVSLESVVLPEKMKETIIASVTHFEQFRKYRKHHPDLDDTISYGVGLTLMFCGPSGTGKTMTANAVAAKLGKKLLLVNFPFLSQSNANDSNADTRQFQSIFREAELADGAIVFFDEAESLFSSRSRGGSAEITELLTELERFEGIVFLATNRPYDLDEAMYRRISEVFEFRPPNFLERLDIWKLLTSPKGIPCDPSIDWESIALQYELTGGFIKNAVMSALLDAVGRDPLSPAILKGDIVEGCKKQVRGALQMIEFDERVLPKAGLDELVASEAIIGQLREMVSLEKARGILFGSWGFDEGMRNRQGTTALFWGPSGTGRSRAAEAVGFELGKPLKIVDLPRLLEEKKGRNNGGSTTAIRNVFQEARLMDAVLVLDGFALPTSGDDGTAGVEGDARSLNLVIREMTRFPGIVIMMVDTVGSLDIFASRLDKGLISGLKFLVEFQLPSLSNRHILWKTLLPASVPVAEEIDWQSLAETSTDFTLAQIGNAIYRAAAVAAMRPNSKERLVTMKDLFAAVEEEKHRGESAVDRWVKSQYI